MSESNDCEVNNVSQDIPEVEICASFKTEPPDSVGDTEFQKNNPSDVPQFVEVNDETSDDEFENDDKNYILSMSDIERELNDYEEKERLENKLLKIEDNLSKYPCSLCDKVYDSYAEMREHKKIHFVQKRTCDICGIICRSIGKLEVHRNAHLGLKPCVCDQCGKSYSSSTQLKIHKRIHTDEKRYKCDQCDQAFRYNSTLKSHIRLTHTKIMDHTCKICTKYCSTPEELKKHISKLHSKKRQKVNCQLCGKVFKTEQLLSCHLKVHTELKFPCEFCQRIYPSLYRLKKHVGRAHIPNVCECKKVFYDRAEFTKHNKEFHKTEDSTVCKYCNKEFDKVKNLAEHVRLQHKGNGKVNKCSICEKEFINQSLLRNHIKIHEKSFKCEFCDKIFGSRYNLQIHLVVHTKERKHKCEICGNHYGTKTALKNHQYVHSEERNYTCPICSKKFKSNHRLYAHKFSHETEKKYECEICHARFTVKQYLNFHMKKHSDVKPFECQPCQRRFKHKRSYDKHCLLERHYKALKTWQSQFRCDHCDEELYSEEALIQHVADEHDILKQIKMEPDEGDNECVLVKSELENDPEKA
ncbi:hypothetical protein HHI36_015920 [Cryptolaemus montrouzieri]|uniref:C2H2-type domain-containing protein n=1 Tax=Cryptolaemus montrouzieri TaxID=559131 RepID=A0ABD2N7A1_9CUCU